MREKGTDRDRTRSPAPETTATARPMGCLPEVGGARGPSALRQQGVASQAEAHESGPMAIGLILTGMAEHGTELVPQASSSWRAGLADGPLRLLGVTRLSMFRSEERPESVAPREQRRSYGNA